MTDHPQPPAILITLPAEQEIGVFAEFAAIWHTPNTFIVDFLSVVATTQQQQVAPDQPPVSVLPARVASRVRIPAEQVFRLIDGLRAQAEQWLAETGREEPPAGWLPSAER